MTGTIPSSLGSLSNLSELWLSNNQLTGTIPSSLGNLSNLWGLHLSSNQLTGTIPSSLDNLSNPSEFEPRQQSVDRRDTVLAVAT